MADQYAPFQAPLVNDYPFDPTENAVETDVQTYYDHPTSHFASPAVQSASFGGQDARLLQTYSATSRKQEVPLYNSSVPRYLVCGPSLIYQFVGREKSSDSIH